MWAMCNLYAAMRSQEELRRLFHVKRDAAGNLPPLPAIYPDALAPIVRIGDDGARELMMMRWGFPPPLQVGSPPVTNVRNTASAYWRPWLDRQFRCLVPATRFCEWTDTRPKIAHWFALSDAEPMFAFAGLYRPWNGTRGPKSAPVEGAHLLFSILTTAPNEVISPIHAKAMPVILATEAEHDLWLEGSVRDALALQRPFPDEGLRAVAIEAAKPSRERAPQAPTLF